MPSQMFTEDEVMAVVKAVARAERRRPQPAPFSVDLRWLTEHEEANRRLLAYVRTGDPKCLENR